MSTQILVKGPEKIGSGPPPLRKEINDLISDKRQWSLYVQAIAALQEVPESDDMSWYALGGIHGRPFAPWNGVPAPKKPDSDTPTQFCSHGTQVFPTWHRPYVSLFEQALVKKAIEVAGGYTQDKEQWLTAAQTLRAPFWDWGLNMLPPPELYVYPTLQITTKDGDVYVSNPLLSYRFTTPLKDDPPSTGTAKVHPDRASFRVGSPDDMKDRLQSYKTMKGDVFKTLMFTHNWQDFSNFGVTVGNKPIANSLEALHGDIHDLTGGGADGDRPGYMAWVPLAGFDPLFWLHHSNVDRLIALWQGLNPKEWVKEEKDKRGTNLHTELTPFRPDYNTFYTSTTEPARKWQDLNFNYPEYEDLNGADEQKIKVVIAQRIIKLYGPDLPHRGTRPPLKDWFVRVHTPTYALGGSYTIYFFFGDPPSSPSQWRTAKNLANVAEVFANPEPENCANCGTDPSSRYELIVNLTEALKQLNKDQDSDEEILRFIQENLQTRVQKIHGLAHVPYEQIPDFTVTVESSIVTFDKPRDPAIPIPVLPDHGGHKEHAVLISVTA